MPDARPAADVPEPSFTRQSRRLVWAIALITLLAVTIYPLYSHLKAVAVLLRIQSSDAHGFLANRGMHPIETQESNYLVESRKLPTRLYYPADLERAPAMVIVHGVHRLGRNEPRLIRFAKAMSSAGIVVATPEVPELTAYEVRDSSVNEIASAADDLALRMHTPCVGVLGLSFAGGLALRAASDPAKAQHICYVVAIGAHDDMARVMKYFATDQAPYPDGSVFSAPAHEYGILIAVFSHPEDYFSARDSVAAKAAIQAKLNEDPETAAKLAKSLSADGQNYLQKLLKGDDSGAKTMLLEHMNRHQYEMEEVSPEENLRQLHVPVMLLHGAADNVIPPSETRWLANDIPKQNLHAVLISAALSHVELGKGALLFDKLRLVHFIERILAEARNAPYNTVGLPRLAGSAVLVR